MTSPHVWLPDQHGCSCVCFALNITWCQAQFETQTTFYLIKSATHKQSTAQMTPDDQRKRFKSHCDLTNHATPKQDKPILDIHAIQAIIRHWKIRFHDYCLLEGYQNPTKNKLTETAEHYIAAK